MTIHRNLWAGYETYFIRMGSSGRYATGIALRNIRGEWRMDFATRYYASDLRHDKEHFPVVGKIDVKKVILDALLKELGRDNEEQAKLDREYGDSPGHPRAAGDMVD